MGYSPWGLKASDTTERLHFLSIVPLGEGSGNPFQYSCLENSMDGGAWWATVHGVAKSQAALQPHSYLLFSVFPSFSSISLAFLTPSLPFPAFLPVFTSLLFLSHLIAA